MLFLGWMWQSLQGMCVDPKHQSERGLLQSGQRLAGKWRSDGRTNGAVVNGGRLVAAVAVGSGRDAQRCSRHEILQITCRAARWRSCDRRTLRKVCKRVA